MIGNRKSVRFRAAALVGLMTLLWITLALQVQSQSGTAPQHTPTGELLTPAGFETWVFVGSNLGLDYKHDLPVTTALENTHADQQVFHNIYIDPEAYAHFVATHEFPDPTVLVMEIFLAADKEPKGVLASGSYNGERVGLQVAVKNSQRPGPHKAWAYYIPLDLHDPLHVLHASRPAFADADCESCHQEHASMDKVWVQFYPILRKLTK
jgi:Cytochrome P460